MGFEGTVRHPASLNVRLFFGAFLHAVPLRLGLAEGALAGCVLAAGLWLKIFLALFRSLFARRATALGSSGGAPWLAALRGPGESS